MLPEIYIKLIIDAAAVLIPSAITVLTLLKKKYYNRSIKTISQKIQNMTNCNKENLNLIHNELNTHNQIIKGYIELKQAGQKIRQITKHALEIVDNTNIKKILTKYTEQFIIYVKEVLDIGIQNIGKDELISKFQIINDNTFFYASSLIGKQNLIAWNEYISKFINNHKNDIIQIFSDPVNDKNSRFLIKSLDFVHTIIKQFVLYFSEYYSNNN